MAEQTEVREGAREVVAPEDLNERLEQAVAERPLTKHLIDMRILLRAVAIAAVLTIICFFLLSPILAAVVLVLSFFASWVLMALHSYEQRRPTRAAEGEDEDEDEAEDQ
jgi:hypothetical protein